MFHRRKHEEIEHLFTASDGLGGTVMAIRGRTDAIIQVAEALQYEGTVASYKRVGAREVHITFAVRVDADNIMPMFYLIKEAAWQRIGNR